MKRLRNSVHEKITLTLFFMITLVSWLPVSSQKVVISGNNPSYSGMEIKVSAYHDFITNSTEELTSFRVDSGGNYQFTILTDQVIQINLKLEYYRGHMFIVPGNEYRIVLPPRRKLSQEQKLNPYFQLKKLHIGVKEARNDTIIPLHQELNHVINDFDNQFNHLYNEAIKHKVIQSLTSKADSIMSVMDSLNNHVSLPFFCEYKKYQKGILEYNLLSIDKQTHDIIAKYFTNHHILYNNPAYMELFHLAFKDYFHFQSNKDQNTGLISSIIKEKSYHRLVQQLQQSPDLKSDSLVEFIILKEVHDNFYNKEFPKKALINIIDSLYFYTSIPQHKYIAQNIREKVTRVMPGFSAPGFTLLDPDSNLVSLHDYKGKFVYLNFCNSMSFTCIQDFKLLKPMYEKIHKYVSFITIAVEDDFQKMIDYKKSESLPWDFLNYKTAPEVVKDYNVKVYPTYYLIDPSGKILLSPAPTPQENLEERLFNILRRCGEI